MQRKFGDVFGDLARAVCAQIGLASAPSSHVVGVKIDGDASLSVEVEPADDALAAAVASGLAARFERAVASSPAWSAARGHVEQNVSMVSDIRLRAAQRAVAEVVTAHEGATETVSQCGAAVLVGPWAVVPVVRLPRADLASIPALRQARRLGPETFPVSLVDAALKGVVDVASRELRRPVPGGMGAIGFFGEAPLVAANAGRALMATAEIASGGGDQLWTLFDRCSAVASLRYERAEVQGSLLVAQRGHAAVHARLRFPEPVPWSETRWIRKLLELATHDVDLLGDAGHVFGVGAAGAEYQTAHEEIFTVRFSGAERWQLLHANEVLMEVSRGMPSLPRSPFDVSAFESRLRALFDLTSEGTRRLAQLACAVSGGHHGTTLIIAPDASRESTRLRTQGTRIEARPMDVETLRMVSSIDGAVLLDTAGTCHAIGVVLDGMAAPGSTPARGARYNSAVRYVAAGTVPRVAVVVSDDGTTDILEGAGTA